MIWHIVLLWLLGGELTLASLPEHPASLPAPATNVTVNGSAAERYTDLTFAKDGFTLSSSNNTFGIIASNVYGIRATNNLTVNLPVTVNFQYDSNGNLTNDGTRSFVYGAENQLTNVFVAGLWKTEFVYDGLGRRRVAKDAVWQSGAWVTNAITRYVYDGMVVVQERDSNNVPQVTYTRGLDLSGGLQGAGGIGGLLARTDTNSSTFYHSDGAGNVTSLSDASQNVVARYEYDAYGRLIGKWGALADANRYRFSSKEVHPNSGLYYYGFRFYDPTLQRWLNQDPIGEDGGINLYGFVGNGSPNNVDLFGLDQEHWWNLGLLGDDEAWSTMFRGWGTGAYDLAMGNPGKGNPMTQGAMRAEMLGGIDIHDNLLRDVMGGATEVTGNLTKYAIEQYVGGRIGAAGVGVGGKLFCELKGMAGLARGAEVLAADTFRFQMAAKGGIDPVLQGQAGVARAIGEYEAAGGQVLGREISLRAGGGLTRPDFYGQSAQGIREFIEVKNGAGAALNPNQARLIPIVETSGALPVGANAARAGLPPGVPVPPTPVRVIKYP